jgi:LysM repeat protein
VVRKGENLSTIAKKYRTTTATLMRMNGMKKSIIFPGQEILVAKPKAKPKRK